MCRYPISVRACTWNALSVLISHITISNGQKRTTKLAISFQKEKVRIDSLTWRAVCCHEKAITAAASRAIHLTCSLEELAPKQTHPRGPSIKDINEDVPQQIQPQLGSVLLTCDALNLMRIQHPHEGFLLFFLKPHHSAEQVHADACLAGTEASFSWAWPQRTARNSAERHQTPGMNHARVWGYPRQIMAPSTQKKTQIGISSLGVKHLLWWRRYPCIRGWVSIQLLSKKCWYSAIWQEKGLNGK